MSEYYASKIVRQAQSWLGLKESDDSFMKILDVYNNMSKTHGVSLPRGYKLKKTDAWCACFTSACALAVNFHRIIPLECSCSKIIEQAKKMAIWLEDESLTPEPGWLVLYDWNDTSGKKDNKSDPDHIGIVEKVKDGVITVIEGNYSDSVKRRTLNVDGKYLRGYVAPAYDEEPEEIPATKPTETPTKPKVKHDYAMNFTVGKAGTYQVTAKVGLHLRTGSSTKKKSILVMPKGELVTCYGYHTGVWYLVQLADGTEGFCHSDYMKKL